MLKPYRGTLPQIAPEAFVEETAVVVGDVKLGAESSVWFGTIIRGDVNSVRIGSRTNVQDGSVIHVTRKTNPTTIGDDVTIGHSVTLHGCTIGDRCLIGIGAIILDGAVIGEESIVAAGALVPAGMIIPPRTLVMGSPAKPKRTTTEADIQHIRQLAGYYIGYMQDYKPSSEES